MSWIYTFQAVLQMCNTAVKMIFIFYIYPGCFLSKEILDIVATNRLNIKRNVLNESFDNILKDPF